jgi:transcriptional regulator with XRE-family HTH domain
VIITEHDQHSTVSLNVGLTLKEQVALDLKVKLEEFRSEKIGLRLIAGKMGINEKTLRRLLRQENRPTYSTLLKIYRVLLDTNNDSLVAELAPEVVRTEILKSNPSNLSRSISHNQDIEAEIKNDRCFAEIYILAGCGLITTELIQFRLGQMGVQTLQRMLKLNVLSRVSENTFMLGENQASLSPDTLANLGRDLIQRYFKSQNCDESGQNFIGFYAEGLDDETYEQWLKIDEEAFQKKVNLTKKMHSLGTKSAMTFMVTEQLK